MSVQDLQEKLGELYKDLMKDNAQIATGTLPKNPGKIKMTKKTIAKIKQVLAAKEVPAKA
ncbi:50S ribosomal protein L29 [Candidatus Woesearchaeota archaeon]|nr:MAG: 50S ribosomal protein L29 [Candidatus Woesearchaeota archaeon]